MSYQNLIPIGLLLILIGIIVLIIGSLNRGYIKVGFGGFIGPFAFGWANDPEMGKWVIALTVIIAIIFLLFALKGIRVF